jgi:hypothetical protein
MDVMHNRKSYRIFATITGLALLAGMAAAQDTVKRGRKYKAPPATAHIEVLVQKPNGKPLMNAAVVFHPVKDGKDEGNLEMKTDTDGKAVIEVIAIGSRMRVQVIANGYASFGDDYDIPTDTKNIVITMKRPMEQYSTFRDNGQSTVTTPGVQELPPKAKAKPQTPGVLPITVPPQTAPATTSPN